LALNRRILHEIKDSISNNINPTALMLKLGSAYGIFRQGIDAHTLDIHKAREFISLRPQRRDDFVSIADLSIYTRIHLEAIKYLKVCHMKCIMLFLKSNNVLIFNTYLSLIIHNQNR
jgi:hypothetical protein